MVGAIIGGVASIAGGIFGSSAAKKAARRAAREKARLQAKLNNLEANRQEIINPYADAKSLSSMISNPFANLGVATKSAEIKIEQSDIALANTLDTIRATGASAGGATALANAALKSKQSVAADIEAQEAQNEKLKAQGEQQMQQQRLAEEVRMQGIEAAGKEFVFSQTERRQQQEIDRTAALMGAAAGAEAQARADQTSAITGMFGGLAQAGIGMIKPS